MIESISIHPPSGRTVPFFTMPWNVNKNEERVKKPVIVLCGKSGSGKSYIPEVLCLKYIPGYTTRELRPNDHKDLYHKPPGTFKDLSEQTCAETFYNDNYYWTLIKDYNNKIYDFAIASFEGLEDLIEKYNKKLLDREMKVVYLDCSLFRRIKNMKKRGDSWFNVFKRILHDKKHFKGAKKYIKNLPYGSVLNL